MITPISLLHRHKGGRVTAETSYPTPEVLNRPNFTVFTSATVTKVVLTKAATSHGLSGLKFNPLVMGPDSRLEPGRKLFSGKFCYPSFPLIMLISPPVPEQFTHLT